MLLEKLCNTAAPSGYEYSVRDIIKSEVKAYADEIKVDRMGNIIVHKNGSGRKIVVCAHMDEVGLIITGYNEDGTLKFQTLGNIDSIALACKFVSIGKEKLPGVIGLKPIHLQDSNEANKRVDINKLRIDIGAQSKAEAKAKVPIGEYATFTTEFGNFGEGCIKGKSFDDRVGCGVLIEILKGNYNCDLYGVFSVQEEIKSRGAYVSAYNINPDVALIIEGTVCNDMPNVDENLNVTKLGKGPAISIMDTSSIFDHNIIKQLQKIAIENNIPYQIRESSASYNDAGSYLMSGKGAKVATIAVPCRYIHSSVSVCSLEDYKNTIKLASEYLKSL